MNVHAKAKAPVEYETMSVYDWIKVPRNTVQYDETIGNPAHLKVLLPEHFTVVMIRSDKGREMKIDGHRRAYRWDNGLLTLPPQLTVIVHNVADVDFDREAVRLFHSYDSKQALKTTGHNLQGALNFHHMTLTTDWLHRGEFSALLNLAGTALRAPKELRERVFFMKDELELFDSISPKKERFPIAFGAAALLFLRKHKTAALAALRNHSNGLGGVLLPDSRQNALSLLNGFLQSERDRKTLAGIANNSRQLAVSLTYMVAGLDSAKLYKKLPKVIDITEYVNSIPVVFKPTFTLVKKP